MGKTEKKINKLLIGAIIGTTLIGFGGLSMTPKGKSWWKRLLGKFKKWGYALAGDKKKKNKK